MDAVTTEPVDVARAGRGRVYLVGAGPGDPELLTVKAARLLGTADAVVYDRLVSDAVLALVGHGTARFFVGKAPGNHAVPQDEINSLLARLAGAGRTVVRLKGGDPLIFGRGSEEAAFLLAREIPCEVVPGITAASGCAAAAGIPLTHRGLANGVRFVTGHCRNNGALALNWASLADPDTTLVVYMGRANVSEIATELMRAGLDGGTPVAVIARGTLPTQVTQTTVLSRLAAIVADRLFESPVLLVIGRVAAMACDNIGEFEAPYHAALG